MAVKLTRRAQRPNSPVIQERTSSSVPLKLTLADYEYMSERGAFDWLRDRRIELIRGEIREMMAPNPPHSLVVSNLTQWSYEHAPSDEVIIRVQDPVGIPELDSSPQPDIVWVRRRDYSKRHPRASDVLLIIEVADTSYPFDTGKNWTCMPSAASRITGSSTCGNIASKYFTSRGGASMASRRPSTMSLSSRRWPSPRSNWQSRGPLP